MSFLSSFGGFSLVTCVGGEMSFNFSGKLLVAGSDVMYLKKY